MAKLSQKQNLVVANLVNLMIDTNYHQYLSIAQRRRETSAGIGIELGCQLLKTKLIFDLGFEIAGVEEHINLQTAPIKVNLSYFLEDFVTKLDDILGFADNPNALAAHH